jgi:hypothetical protein
VFLTLSVNAAKVASSTCETKAPIVVAITMEAMCVLERVEAELAARPVAAPVSERVDV